MVYDFDKDIKRIIRHSTVTAAYDYHRKNDRNLSALQIIDNLIGLLERPTLEEIEEIAEIIRDNYPETESERIIFVLKSRFNV